MSLNETIIIRETKVRFDFKSMVDKTKELLEERTATEIQKLEKNLTKTENELKQNFKTAIKNLKETMENEDECVRKDFERNLLRHRGKQNIFFDSL